MKIDEGNVVKYLLKKNEKALDFVIDNYGGLIKSIVWKHLHSLESIQEECIDDILLAIWNNIDKYCKEKNSFKNWVAAVAKYKAIDYKRKYIKLLEQEDLESSNLESHLRVEEKVLENELSYEIQSLLNNLKEEDKNLFIKRYIEEEDIDTIAQGMGVKSSVIYNRLSRGRKKLKTIFEKNQI